jgi:hypothetical protein
VIGRLTTLFGACLLGALAGWTAALAAAHPDWGAAPRPALLVYGALTLFGGGYLLGSAVRGRFLHSLAARSLLAAGLLALAAKVLAPQLAAWTAFLIASAVFGVVCGMVRARPAPDAR